jgi:hypothetical protein
LHKRPWQDGEGKKGGSEQDGRRNKAAKLKLIDTETTTIRQARAACEVQGVR